MGSTIMIVIFYIFLSIGAISALFTIFITKVDDIDKSWHIWLGSTIGCTILCILIKMLISINTILELLNIHLSPA